MTDIFGNIGIGTVLILVILAVLLVLVIVLFVMLRNEKRAQLNLERRVGRFVRGSDGRSLEDTMARMFDEHDELMKTQKDNRRDIDDLYERLHSVIQKVGVIKYDAFQQMGGNLSSSIALLDEDNNGFIINTVQSVDGCYSYVKEIHEGKPDIDLGKEEAQALEKAMHRG